MNQQISERAKKQVPIAIMAENVHKLKEIFSSGKNQMR
jgi:hypothetical protein